MGLKDSFLKSCSDIKASANRFGNDVKLEHKKNVLKQELEDMFNTLGKIRFSELQSGEISNEETDRIVKEINRLSLEINELNNSKEIKCPVCGKSLVEIKEFCPYCGANIKGKI